MVSRIIQVTNSSGLHLRPAGTVCEKAVQYECRIRMRIDEKEYNVKSVLSVLSARITMPRQVELICDGPDEEKALEEMSALLQEEL